MLQTFFFQKIVVEISIIGQFWTRAASLGAGGGGAKGPLWFSQIAPEVLGISLWNLPYLSGQ